MIYSALAQEYRYFPGCGLTYRDLISAGSQGLIRAANDFNETRGYKFITYAVWWIRSSILDTIMKFSRIVRLPHSYQRESVKIHKTYLYLECSLKRPPSPDEVATHLKVTTRSVEQTFRKNIITTSLDQSIKNSHANDASLNSLYDIVPDVGVTSPDRGVLLESRDCILDSALSVLTPRERTVVSLYYGLDGNKALTLREVGQKLGGLTKERVRVIRNDALRKLRHPKRLRMFRDIQTLL